MKTNIFAFAIGCLAGIASAPASAQSMTADERAARLLEIQQTATQKHARAVSARGRSDQATQLLAHLKSTSIARGRNPELREALLLDQAQRLALTGFTVGKIKSLEARGINIADAVEADFLGSLEQYAALSEVVVLARVSKVATENLGDGFLSSITLDIEEVLKGSLADPTAVVVRELSGSTGGDTRITYSHELTDGSLGKRYLLFLSNGLYAASAARHGATAEPSNYYVHHRLGYRVDESGKLSAIEVGPPEVAGGLAEAKTRIAKVALAFKDTQEAN